MARYRKVDPRMWSDAKFRKLSRDGKFVFMYLLTGPETTSLPGVIMAGEAGLAEAVGMDLEAFRKAFQEVSSKGMAEANWEARFVWVRNAIKYNGPESPNVIRGWRDHWDNAPECPLKVIAYRRLRDFVEGLSKGFLKAFEEAIEDPSRNQEQEQEQEQDTSGGCGSHEPEPADAVSTTHTVVHEKPDGTKKVRMEDLLRQQPLKAKEQTMLGWERWTTLYASSVRAYGEYVRHPEDGRVMVRIVSHAKDVGLEELRRRNKPQTALDAVVLQLLDHWFKAYLRDDGDRGFLAEHHHGLRWLARDLPKYGTPWSKSRVADPKKVDPVPKAFKDAEAELIKSTGTV